MHRQPFVYFDNRPAFVQIIDIKQPNFNGYTLQIDLQHKSASIIISKKGGEKTMIKSVEKIKDGFEEIHALLVAKKEALEEEIRREFAEKSVAIDDMLSRCIEVVEIEVPDEIEAEAEAEEIVAEGVDNVDYQG